jgi:hypothetical protein
VLLLGSGDGRVLLDLLAARGRDLAALLLATSAETACSANCRRVASLANSLSPMISGSCWSGVPSLLSESMATRSWSPLGSRRCWPPSLCHDRSLPEISCRLADQAVAVVWKTRTALASCMVPSARSKPRKPTCRKSA